MAGKVNLVQTPYGGFELGDGWFEKLMNSYSSSTYLQHRRQQLMTTYDTPTVGFRVDAGREVGLGHIVRSVALARKLRERGCLCWFYGNNRACCIAAREGFAVVDMDVCAGAHIGGKHDPGDARVWVVDLQEGCPPNVAEELRPRCETLVIMNGVGYSSDDPARFLADLVFYQGVSERPYSLDWTGFEGQWYEGIEWTMLRPEFVAARKQVPASMHDPLRVFVSGGGANKGSVAERIVRALAGEGYEIAVVGGMAVVGFDEKLSQQANVHVGLSAQEMAELMAWADIAVVAYGVTPLECLCVGLPTLALSLAQPHLEGARIVEKRSEMALVSMGMVDEVDEETIARYVKIIQRFPEGRAEAAQAFIDGFGVGRVADVIEERLGIRDEKACGFW